MKKLLTVKIVDNSAANVVSPRLYIYIPVKLMEPEILISEVKSKESCNYFYTGQTIATF